MNLFEEKLQSLALNEPPSELKQRVLKNAAIGAGKPVAGKSSGMLVALVSSKWFLLLILPLMVVGSVGAFAYALEERGAVNKWNAVQTMLDDAGESLDLESFFPVPVPDRENFLGTPALKGLELGTNGLSEEHPRMLKYRRIEALPVFTISKESSQAQGEPLDFSRWEIRATGESAAKKIGEMGGVPEEVVLHLIEEDAALLEELTAAAKRPFAQVSTPIGERLAGRHVWELSSGHLGLLQKLTKITTFRAIAAARLGDRQKARESLEILFQCQSAVFSGGTLINGLVGISQRATFAKYLPDILREVCWTEEDLVWVQQQIAEGSGFDEGLRMFRGEMAAQARIYDGLLAISGKERRDLLRSMRGLGTSGFDASALSLFLPNGFVQRNKATSVRWIYQFNIEPFKNRDVEAILATNNRLESELAARTWFSFGSHLAANNTPGIGMIARKNLKSEMQRRLMEAAVALERYHRSQGAFPASLNSLVPTYIDAVPTDLIAEEGVPVGYAPEGDGYHLTTTPVSAEPKDKVELIR